MSALAFESILFLLTIFKFFQFAPLHRKQGTLLHVFMRDGTWAYTTTFGKLLLSFSLDINVSDEDHYEVVMLVNGVAVYAHIHTPLAGASYQWAMAGFSCTVRPVLSPPSPPHSCIILHYRALICSSTSDNSHTAKATVTRMYIAMPNKHLLAYLSQPRHTSNLRSSRQRLELDRVKW